ncbi:MULTISPECIES: hypothetical protein [unclassified Paenibacillus]
MSRSNAGFLSVIDSSHSPAIALNYCEIGEDAVGDLTVPDKKS